MYSRMFVTELIRERQAELLREAEIARRYPSRQGGKKRGSIFRILTMLLMRSN
jgi:hypothetical protein